MSKVDWRQLFKRYADLVGGYEGVTFLYEHDWSADEWAAINAAMDEVYREASE